MLERLEPRQFLSATPSHVLQNVPEASGYKLVYDLDVPVLGGDFTHNAVPYSVNNAASTTQPFDRVAYYMELTNAAGATQWVYASFKTINADPKKIGVPTVGSGAFFQGKLASMNVFSNVPGVATGTGLAGGNIEFFPRSYVATNALNVLNANSTDFDAGDQTQGYIAGASVYGSMQIHNSAAGQTVFAYNDWGGLHPNQNVEIGIGNSPTVGKDWTGNNSAGLWSARRIQVLVHPATVIAPSPPPPPIPTTTTTLGKIFALGDSITWGYTDRVAPTGGYRSRLYTDLTNAGQTFQYVGAVRDTYSTLLRSVKEEYHEGHGGFRTDQILGNLTGVAPGTNVSSNEGGHWLDGTATRAAVNPNLILLHIGTNDFLQGRTVASAISNLDKIIQKLTTLRPNARLFVSSIIPLADPTKNAKVKDYNQQIKDGLVPKFVALGKKVTFVDQYRNFIDSTGKVLAVSLSDGVHPSRAGYDKMGDTWAQAILNATRKR